jgi:hypothetical protein
MTRFDVPSLADVTVQLAAVASGRSAPDLVIRGGRILSVYTERMLAAREIWVSRGRIAAVKPAGTCSFSDARIYDAAGGILAPGLVDAHLHIESSMMTACAYAEAALLNGTTTLFCDSHEIGNVCDVEGIEWMLEDARQAPINIFLTVPSTVPATHAGLETAGGNLTPEKIAGLKQSLWVKRWILSRSLKGTFVLTQFWRKHYGADVRFAGTFMVAHLLRLMLQPESQIPMKRSTTKLRMTCLRRVSGFF